MDNIIDFVSYLALVSVSVERGTELLKKFLFSRFEVTNAGVYQFAAFALGGAFCWASPPQLSIITNQYVLIPLVGLGASSGSALWYEVLSLLRDFRKNQAAK